MRSRRKTERERGVGRRGESEKKIWQRGGGNLGNIWNEVFRDCACRGEGTVDIDDVHSQGDGWEEG